MKADIEKSYLRNVSNGRCRDTARKYLRALKAKGRKKSTREHNAKVLRDLSNYIDKPFEEADKSDLENFFADLQLAESTKNVYKGVVKTFYKWLEGNDETYPQKVRWILVRRIGRNLQSTDLLEPVEVKAMINACLNARNRAIVATLYESGLRLGEFLSLKIEDVKFKGGWASIVLPKDATNLKTGRRVITIVDSVPYLQSWIEEHPFGEDPKSPLWIPIQGGAKKSKLEISAFGRLVKKIVADAGIRKDVTPHLFRHTSATEKARKGWNEALMRQYFGWSKRSTMPSVYVHLARADTENKVLEDAGLKEKENTKERTLAPKQCPRCELQNEATGLFCSRCGSVLGIEEATEAEKLIRIIEDEESMNRLAEILAERVMQKVGDSS